MMSFLKPEGCQQDGRQGEKSRGQGNCPIIAARGAQHEESNDGSDNESDAECRADESESLRTSLLIRVVRDRGLRSGDIGAGEPVNDAGEEEQPEGIGETQENKSGQRSHLADEENRCAPETIREPTQDRRADELHQRVGGL